MEIDTRKERTIKVYDALKKMNIKKLDDWELTGNKEYLIDSKGKVFKFNIYGIITTIDFTKILFTVNGSYHSFKTIPLDI